MSRMCRAPMLLGILAVLVSVSIAQAQDTEILIADFENADHGQWTVVGTAFGPGPARGALPGQMEVSGYRGERLVNSFHGGDAGTGTLTSPEFTIERAYITFLIGGGGYADQTCMNLIVDGDAVLTATGPNTQSGGTERLEPAAWDVSDLKGKSARIQIVDRATEGWGHINVDHIVMTDVKPPLILKNPRREIALDARYLALPVSHGNQARRVRILVDGQLVRDAEIAIAHADVETFTHMDLEDYLGNTVVVEVDQIRDDSAFLTDIRTTESIPEPASLYEEAHRPRFHFTAATGWLNDPNGMVYFQGEYHLFFQHNPYGLPWGNLTWGHAVSPDMVHWTELDDALHPDRLGTMFSGSAVVDWNNTAGFQTGDKPALVSIYTTAGGTSELSADQPFTQSIAYSNDRGRTWTKYAENPVLGHIAGENRDPKVVWHEPTRRWVMALYLEGNDFALFSSPDLKTWTHLQTFAMSGCDECPDFFELPIEGEDESRWVYTAANARYLIGSFDGQTFTPETPDPLPGNWGRNYYAVQTFSDVSPEDGRRIQIGWMRNGVYPEMPFNQQMSIPGVLTLKRYPEGLRLRRAPVREIESLRTESHTWTDQDMGPDDENPLADLSGDLFDIRLVVEPREAAEVSLTIRGARAAWSAADRQLSLLDASAPVELEDGRIELQILVDRTSLEVFAQDGKVPMTACFLPPTDDTSLSLEAKGGTARIVSMEVHELRSVWNQPAENSDPANPSGIEHP